MTQGSFVRGLVRPQGCGDVWLLLMLRSLPVTPEWPMMSPEARELPETVWEMLRASTRRFSGARSGPSVENQRCSGTVCPHTFLTPPRPGGTRWEINFHPLPSKAGIHPTFQPSAGPSVLVTVAVQPPRLPPWAPQPEPCPQLGG